MTAPELKPCPFCGAVDPEWLASHVVCDCGATGPRQDVDREYQADAMRALTDWNRRADLAAVQPAQVPETCGKCMGSGYGGHPDSGQLCADCNGSGGVEPQPDPRDAQIAALVEAATEAEEVLSLVEKPETPDPRHHEMIKELGRKIGFGAIMSTASAGWREVLVEKGYAAGGEFVSGPCHKTVVATLKQLRAALAAVKCGDA